MTWRYPHYARKRRSGLAFGTFALCPGRSHETLADALQGRVNSGPLIPSIKKSEPLSVRCTASLVTTSFAVGPTRVRHPSASQSTCQAEIYSTLADLLRTLIRSSPSDPDTSLAILSGMVCRNR